jgi:hypothetical protein
MTCSPERVSLPPAELCLKCGGSTPLSFFASALAFQTVAAAGPERKEPNQSGVEPPHFKQACRPMEHAIANAGNSGRLECPQKDLGKSACRWQDARYNMRGAETSGHCSLPSLFRRGKKRRPADRWKNDMIAVRNRRHWRRPKRTGGGASWCWVASPGGTISFQVLDVHRYVIATYVGTDDSGATKIDPTEGPAASNDNMVPDASETGHGDGRGRQQ